MSLYADTLSDLSKSGLAPHLALHTAEVVHHFRTSRLVKNSTAVSDGSRVFATVVLDDAAGADSDAVADAALTALEDEGWSREVAATFLETCKRRGYAWATARRAAPDYGLKRP